MNPALSGHEDGVVLGPVVHTVLITCYSRGASRLLRCWGGAPCCACRKGI